MLYLCATPIGNLGDMTFRAVETLRNADVIYCEDTRRTQILLQHFDIKKPLVSCHQHNEKSRADEVCDRVEAGETVVYVSDAGMPGVSDPGAALVSACIGRDLPYTVLPGASAVLTAAVLSGLPPQPFTFFGFLPREGGEARAVLASVRDCGHLALLYESPLRVKKTLSALLNACGDCHAAVLRELTKRFEEVRRGTLSELIAFYEEPPKGECVIAVYPEGKQNDASEDDLDAVLERALNGGMRVRDAAALAAQTLHIPKKTAYARALAISEGGKEA